MYTHGVKQEMFSAFTEPCLSHEKFKLAIDESMSLSGIKLFRRRSVGNSTFNEKLSGGAGKIIEAETLFRSICNTNVKATT